MNPRQRIFLVRHGETRWSLSRQHTGRTDLPLTPNGEAQAREVAQRLRGLEVSEVWTSPLKRAADTCISAGYGKHAKIIGDLMEWDYGEFEGKTTAEISELRPAWQVWDAQEGLGESLEDIGARADHIVAKMIESNRDILIFSHAHFLRILAARWVGMSADFGRHLTLEPASISELSFEHTSRVIRFWNSVSGAIIR